MLTQRLQALALGLLLALGTGVASADTASSLNKVLDSGKLRVGTTGDFNPMSFKDPETKEYRGHQIDAARQLAADMGVEVEFVATDWKTLINGIVADKYDIVMTGTSMTVGRAKAAGYTIPWGRTGYLPLARRDEANRFKSWDDLNNADVTIGYNLGTSFAEFVKTRLPKAKRKEVESPARDWQELLAGRLCAILDTTDPEVLPANSPLYNLPNVFLTPHIAGSLGDETQRLADYMVAEIERFVRGNALKYLVRREHLARLA